VGCALLACLALTGCLSQASARQQPQVQPRRPTRASGVDMLRGPTHTTLPVARAGAGPGYGLATALRKFHTIWRLPRSSAATRAALDPRLAPVKAGAVRAPCCWVL